MSESIEAITIFVLPLTIVTFLLYIFAKAMEVDDDALAKAFVVALASNLIYFFVAIASGDVLGLIFVFIS